VIPFGALDELCGDGVMTGASDRGCSNVSIDREGKICVIDAITIDREGKICAIAAINNVGCARFRQLGQADGGVVGGMV
jgi:hypothetical protein